MSSFPFLPSALASLPLPLPPRADALLFAAAACGAAAALALRRTAARPAARAAPPPLPRDAEASLRAAKRALDAQPACFGLAARALFPTDFAAPMVEQPDPSMRCRVHLNHGSYGVAPLEVTAAQRQLADAVERWPDDFFRRKSFPAFEAAAAEAARFLRAPAGSVVFVENATTGVNAVLASLDLKRGDAVLLNDNSYNACKNAARHVCARAGAAVLYQDLPFPEALARGDDGVVADFAAFLDANATAHAADPARTPRIRFALVDHITSPTAVVLPVARLAAACRARGVLVMVDGAHAPGQIEVDLTALGEAGVDWYVGNLHKWCFAPKGVAVLFAAARHQGAEAFAGGGTQAAVVSHFFQKSFAKRFWMQGTNDQSRLLATGAALRFCEARLGGFGAVRAYNAALASAGAQLLCAAWGTRRMYDPALSAPFLAVVETPLDWRRWVRVAGPGDAPGAAPTADATRLSPAAALAALDADEGFNERVSEAVLFNYGINGVFFTWTVGEKRLFTRVSAQVYNVLEDYAALALAVLDLARGEAAAAAADKAADAARAAADKAAKGASS